MMTLETYLKFVERLKRLNSLSDAEAERYAVLIGDTPISDGHGKVIVREDDGREIARVKYA